MALAPQRNVYWRISLGLPLGSNSVFWGTAVTNGSIALLSGAFLTGRGLTQASRPTIFQAIIGAATDALLGPGQNVSLRHDATTPPRQLRWPRRRQRRRAVPQRPVLQFPDEQCGQHPPSANNLPLKCARTIRLPTKNTFHEMWKVFFVGSTSIQTRRDKSGIFTPRRSHRQADCCLTERRRRKRGDTRMRLHEGGYPVPQIGLDGAGVQAHAAELHGRAGWAVAAVVVVVFGGVAHEEPVAGFGVKIKPA